MYYLTLYEDWRHDHGTTDVGAMGKVVPTAPMAVFWAFILSGDMRSGKEVTRVKAFFWNPD